MHRHASSLHPPSSSLALAHHFMHHTSSITSRISGQPQQRRGVVLHFISTPRHLGRGASPSCASNQTDVDRPLPWPWRRALARCGGASSTCARGQCPLRRPCAGSADSRTRASRTNKKGLSTARSSVLGNVLFTLIIIYAEVILVPDCQCRSLHASSVTFRRSFGGRMCVPNRYNLFTMPWI